MDKSSSRYRMYGTRGQTADTSSGDITANGMTRDGEIYLNEPYKDSDVSLSLSIEASSGDINFRLAE